MLRFYVLENYIYIFISLEIAITFVIETKACLEEGKPLVVLAMFPRIETAFQLPNLSQLLCRAHLHVGICKIFTFV